MSSEIFNQDYKYNYRQRSQAAWTICRTIEQKSQKQIENENSLIVEYLTAQNDIEKAKIDKDTLKQLSTSIGSRSQLTYKKVVLRKYNSALKRLQAFGLQLLVGVPKWASYNDLIKIVERYIDNLKQKEAKYYDNDERQNKGDYIIRFLQPTRQKCIFCQMDIPVASLEQKDLVHCCSILQKDIPHPWIAKSKSFWIYVDWIDFSKCNSSFCSYIQIDQISRNVQSSRQDNHINLEACMKLQSQAEVVEMECDKCKQKYQDLEHLIGSMPNILIMHMKQFRYTPEGHLIKLDLRLRWQEILDSSKYALTANGKLYELFAIVKHSGSSQSGHYTCMAKRKHPFQNKKVWVNFDDDFTTIIKQQQKFIDDAYLLFYKKVDMPTSSLVIYSDLDSL